MGGAWRIPTDNPLIRGDDWGWYPRYEHGPREWPSYSVRKWYWEAD